jgi:hypothetical protein
VRSDDLGDRCGSDGESRRSMEEKRPSLRVFGARLHEVSSSLEDERARVASSCAGLGVSFSGQASQWR